MKYVLATLLTIGLLFSVCSAYEKVELKDERNKESYSLGYLFGENLKRQGIDINLEVYTTGIKDALGWKERLMSSEEINTTVKNLQQRLLVAQQKALKEQAAKNLSEGKAFLEENSKKEGVKMLPSGLQYKVLQEGLGKTPEETDTVTVHYRGTFIDGTEFDNSYKRGNPETVAVVNVIPAWSEALRQMKEGAKWQLFVPPDLAYGERGQGSRIPPNSTLIFEIELISIQSNGSH